MISSIIVGIATGLVSSFIIWYLFSRTVCPKIEISSSISKTHSLVAKTPMFRLKIENLSRFPIYHICLQARIRLFDLGETKRDRPYTYVVKVGNGSHPYIEGSRETTHLEASGREFLLRPTKTAKSQLSQLWQIPESQVNIETLLQKDVRNTLEISVVGIHGFSGARKTFVQQYHYADIQPFPFSTKGTQLDSNVNQYDVVEIGDIADFDE